MTGSRRTFVLIGIFLAGLAVLLPNAGERRPSTAQAMTLAAIDVSLGIMARDTTATAFRLGASGWFVTARHSVDRCDSVDLISEDGAVEPIARAPRLHPNRDLALLFADESDVPALALTDAEATLGDSLQAGFPGGRPGGALTAHFGRIELRLNDRAETRQPADVWAISLRFPGFLSRFEGLSGAPAIDPPGRIAGVTVAAQARRGRLFTAPADDVRFLLETHRPAWANGLARPFTSDAAASHAKALRASRQIVKLVCHVDNDTQRRRHFSL